jgi:hypothetical protein
LGNGSVGRGDGTFATKVDYLLGGGADDVKLGDFNDDGILDLAVARGSLTGVSVLLGGGSGGRGDGTFGTKVDYPTGSAPTFAAIGDFNTDGILDLAVLNASSNSVSILLGNGSGGQGDGTFATKVDYTTGTQPHDMTTGDFNTDGILDLAVANVSSNNVSVLLGHGSAGQGNGKFAARVDYPAGTETMSVTTGDFNADSILDLAVANRVSNSVGILFGNGSGGRGDGTFAPMVDYAVGINPYFVTTGDFNSDGIVDLAVANNGSNNVSVLLGMGVCQ